MGWDWLGLNIGKLRLAKVPTGPGPGDMVCTVNDIIVNPMFSFRMGRDVLYSIYHYSDHVPSS